MYFFDSPLRPLAEFEVSLRDGIVTHMKFRLFGFLGILKISNVLVQAGNLIAINRTLHFRQNFLAPRFKVFDSALNHFCRIEQSLDDLEKQQLELVGQDFVQPLHIVDIVNRLRPHFFFEIKCHSAIQPNGKLISIVGLRVVSDNFGSQFTDFSKLFQYSRLVMYLLVTLTL